MFEFLIVQHVLSEWHPQSHSICKPPLGINIITKNACSILHRFEWPKLKFFERISAHGFQFNRRPVRFIAEDCVYDSHGFQFSGDTTFDAIAVVIRLVLKQFDTDARSLLIATAPVSPWAPQLGLPAACPHSTTLKPRILTRKLLI